MDPRGQALRKHATHMLQFKPGSDVAMMNSIMNVIVEEGLYNSAYINDHTLGFEDLKRELKSYTPEKMDKITGLEPSVI